MFAGRPLRVNKSVPKEQVENKPTRKELDGTQKLYVGNIRFDATKDSLMELFSQYGEVFELYIPQNADTGTGRGFAFVTMKEEDAQKAIEATKGMEFEGRKIVVSVPLPRGEKLNKKRGGGGPSRDRNTKMYVGNLSFYTVADTLVELFGEFGDVVDCYLPEDPANGGSRGFGFVTMAPEDAKQAIEELDGCEIDGRIIRVNEAQPKKARQIMYEDNSDDEDDSYF